MTTEKERIEKIIANEQITAKQFCEEVGITQSTLSNIFANRNKPSLEVLQKILNRYRTISSDWLILGVGQMYRQISDSQQALFDIRPLDVEAPQQPQQSQQPQQAQPFQQFQQPTPTIPTTPRTVSTKPTITQTIPPSTPPRTVKKVVVFFSDDTFQEINV